MLFEKNIIKNIYFKTYILCLFPDELIHTANISKPKHCFFSTTAHKVHYETLKKLNILQNVFVFGKTTEEGISFDDLFSEEAKKDVLPADHQGKVQTSLILYSSGTTGLPKGAKITNQNLITTLFQKQITSNDSTLLTVTPWCNTYGIMTMKDGLSYGRTIIFLERFEETMYLQVIQKYKVKALVVAPPTLIVMSKSSVLDMYDVSSVELMHSGGAPLDSDVITLVKSRFKNLHHVTQGYGMTEATGIICRDIDLYPKQGSVGKVLEGITVKVVDAQTRKILGPNHAGEVCVKGLALFDGYIGKERGDDFDEEGFFKTGDVAYYDNEGFFFIVDRIKELIKYKAWQVSPSELEAVLLLHPSVKDVGVTGIPDPTAGELPVAFIVKKPGAFVTEKEIFDFVATKVSPWKRLRGGVIFIEEIPKTGSGKILRRQLRAMIQKKPSSKL
ncbi:unnamed protein product [Chilo suppressalis]|uniref:Luciferin 4-monooxygenase n=1 Tax=Chilo suppressalis TaxID=168631 RepID=A0ABN8L9K8_CHISP|nr:unnamed protein product [Chilo suppressalis]